jgi:hypothetical protein
LCHPHAGDLPQPDFNKPSVVEKGEVEQSTKEGSKHSSIPEAGGLGRHQTWWRQHCRSTWVLQWVTEGFPLSWADASNLPPASHQPNHQGAFQYADFIEECVKDLLKAKAVRHVKAKPKVVNPLNVTPKKNGKLRLILDLRHVNEYLSIPKFKMDSLKLLSTLATRGERLFAIDLAHGYHQIEMSKEAQDYLGFEWEGQFYVFTALPFGLASAPWCFTKVMLTVVDHLRSKGVKVIAYLDDFCFIVPAAQSQAENIRALVLETFEAAGLTINREKSTLDFVTRLEHLGIIVNMTSGQFEVPEKRWDTFQAIIRQILTSKRTHVKWVAQVAGHAISMSLALGGVTRLFTRHCYYLTSTYPNHAWVRPSQGLQQELQFWLGMRRTRFTGPIWPGVQTFNCKVNTDAGKMSWGAVMEGKKAQGFFDLKTRATSSTLRELLAVWHTLRAFSTDIAGKRVQLLCDNQSLERVIPYGSMKPDIQKVAANIFWLLADLKTNLVVSWVPRELNKEADAMTRWFDHDDWQLNHKHFALAEQLWGPHSIDRFAGHLNNLLPQFNSLHHCPGTNGVNAMSQNDWSRHNNWCNPPFTMIPELLKILELHKAAATVVVPFWTSRPWWPMLIVSKDTFQPFVLGCKELDRSVDLFRPGPSQGNAAGVGAPKWRVLILRISFRPGSKFGRERVPH